MRTLLLVLVCLLCSCQSTPVPEEPKKPNILLIMADDMGYSDLGCYGGEIHTPHLDRLASEGLRFTQFYNAARCCPTRASLLTGISPHLAGMGGMVMPKPAESPHAYQGYLNNQCVTLAEVLKPAGYRTYMSGKWHVGEFRPVFPVDRGFDRYYGLISGAMNYWNITKGKRAGIERKSAQDTVLINDQVRDGFYATHAYTDKAIQFLDDHFDKDEERPFFLYLAHQAPHWPLHAPDSAIAKYRGKYLEGWHVLREKRHERMKQLGLAFGELSPLDDESLPWDSLTEGQRDTMDLKMATYAAQVELLDAGIGRVVDRLRDAGQLDNTLIMFLSDNGASAESGPFGQNFRLDLVGAMGSEDSYHSYGLAWANASNTPFRKFKRYTYEGGLATPFIVRWGEIANKNAVSDALGHITDVMATVIDIGDATYPLTRQGQPIHPLEGKSLRPLLVGETTDIRAADDALLWEHFNAQAIRKGDWKLVRSHQEDDWRLYNLDKDRTELNDLAAVRPEVVSTMAAEFHSWAESVGVRNPKREINQP